MTHAFDPLIKQELIGDLEFLSQARRIYRLLTLVAIVKFLIEMNVQNVSLRWFRETNQIWELELGNIDQLSTILLANCAVFLASIVHASTGMGFAMIAAPLLAIISLEFVPGPMLFVNLFLTALMLGESRSNIVRSEVLILLPAIAFGTILAVTILSNVSTHLFSIIFAVLILLAVAISLVARIPRLSFPVLSIGGTIAGLMGTMAGISGPPLAVLYQREEINKTRATLSLVFSFSYIASLIALTFAGKFNFELALKGLLMLPGLLAGFVFARYIRDLLSQSSARALMLSIASLGALLLLYKTIM